MSLRILYLGHNWYGSCARACCHTLRRLGHEVQELDGQTFFPQLQYRPARALRRAFRRYLVAEYNDAVERVARTFRPDLLLAFKGTYVTATSLRILRRQGVALYNYYPDPSAFAYGPWLPASLPEYDCIFYTKPFWNADARAELDLGETRFLRHGYDPEIHRCWNLEARDLDQYQHDVVVIATHSLRKEKLLQELIKILPGLELRIWGNGWAERCSTSVLNDAIVGAPLLGVAYAKAIAAARINLATLNERAYGASQADETTTRTFEIPACGGFMLHQRTEEVRNLFEEDREIVCYDSAEEAAEKIEYYLAHAEAREAIARAGQERCVPAYSSDKRMAEIIDWHRTRTGS